MFNLSKLTYCDYNCSMQLKREKIADMNKMNGSTSQKYFPLLPPVISEMAVKKPGGPLELERKSKKRKSGNQPK